MKKLLFGLIATVMFAFVGNAQTFSPLENYGKLHNEYVNLFLETGKKVSDYKDLKEFISDYYDIISKKYPLIDKKTFLNEFNNTFLNDYIASGNSKIVFKNLIDKMYKENKISKLFLDKMIQILDTKDDYAKLIILTNEIENLQLTNFERNAIGVFKSTLQNSNKLWTTLTSRTAPPGSWTIIGDAVGAFVFCYIPPLAAVAGGAISLAVHNSNNP